MLQPSVCASLASGISCMEVGSRQYHLLTSAALPALYTHNPRSQAFPGSRFFDRFPNGRRLASFPGSPERELSPRVQLQFRVPERRSLGTRLDVDAALTVSCPDQYIWTGNYTPQTISSLDRSETVHRDKWQSEVTLPLVDNLLTLPPLENEGCPNCMHI